MPRNHSYFIAIPIPEPLNTQIESIKREISLNFGTKSVLKSPPHITMIPPFFWGNEEQLLMLVDGFSFPSFEIRLKNYDFFQLGVVFIDVVENQDLVKLHQQFEDVFYTSYPQLKKKAKFPFHPHITVGNRDWKKESFLKCWEEKKNEKFEEIFFCKKLTLLKNINGLWLPLSAGQ